MLLNLNAPFWDEKLQLAEAEGVGLCCVVVSLSCILRYVPVRSMIVGCNKDHLLSHQLQSPAVPRFDLTEVQRLQSQLTLRGTQSMLVRKRGLEDR